MCALLQVALENIRAQIIVRTTQRMNTAMTQPTLLTLSGSLRHDSVNRKLLRAAAQAFGPANVVEADLNLPLFNGDLESDQGIPDAVRTLGDQIKAADALVISSPEYNKGISGVMKNALDWISRLDGAVMTGKPTVLMTAAAGRAGGEAAYYMLIHCVTPLGAQIVNGPAVNVAGAAKEFDDSGALTNEFITSLLEKRMQALRAAI